MANPTWKYFPEQCDNCGSDTEIFTTGTEEGYGYDGDPVRCTECGAAGYWSGGDDEAGFYVNWVDV